MEPERKIKPSASATDIQAALTAKRVKASVVLLVDAPEPSGQVSLDHLEAAQRLVLRVESIDAARATIEALAKLR